MVLANSLGTKNTAKNELLAYTSDALNVNTVKL